VFQVVPKLNFRIYKALILEAARARARTHTQVYIYIGTQEEMSEIPKILIKIVSKKRRGHALNGLPNVQVSHHWGS
jgi:hypothetical protein